MPLPSPRPTRLVGLFVALALLASPSPAAASTTTGAAPLSKTAPAGMSTAATTPAWWWPIDPPRAIVRPFVAPATKYGAGHRGIDIAAADGSAVHAPADGVVYFAGVVVNRPVLSIRHADGLMSSYEPVAAVLPVGAVVHRGDIVGTIQAGAEPPGHCATPCLHFGARLYGEYVSPLLYLGGIPHSVLLPTRQLH